MGAQSPTLLQHGDAPAAASPQTPAVHVAVWQELPAGQAVHIVPQEATLLSARHTPPQS
jgi:hypothetical protein